MWGRDHEFGRDRGAQGRVGPVEEVSRRRELALARGSIGIGHTRWATHGGVSEQNAHPHCSCGREFALVHNGIFSNYQALRRDLECHGHRFGSETDTEAFAHLLEEAHRHGASVEEAVS